MLVRAEIDLHKRTPLRPLRFANQVHAGFLRRAIGLERIALDAGANDIFPRRRPAPIAGDNVIQIQVVAVESFPAVLAHVFVPLENIVPCEFDLFLRQMVIDHQQNNAWHSNPERNRSDGLRVRLLLGKIVPLVEIVSLERAVVPIKDNLSLALKQQRKGPSSRAYIHRLPEAIQHQHMLVEHGTHSRFQLPQKYTNLPRVSTQRQTGSLEPSAPETECAGKAQRRRRFGSSGRRELILK